jgi:site-specific recombinase XerD
MTFREQTWTRCELSCRSTGGVNGLSARAKGIGIAAGFRKMLARTSVEAKFPFLVHPHMLRHACGFKLANDGRDTRALQHYLGHKNIQHTVRYTELSPDRFKNF